MSLTTLDDAATLARPEPERDRWGRYVIPHPQSSKKTAWTRATTMAKTCSDTFGLTKWELRMVSAGLAKRPDLLAKAATVNDLDDPDGKALLNRIAEDAKEAAGSSVRSNLGTALHSFTEVLDAGGTPNVPEQYRPDIDAYRATLTAAGVQVHPEYIERIVTVPELVVAGTLDRLVTFGGRLMVADLKTGRDVSYGMGEISIQLALYAHAETMWDQAEGKHLPMPTVDQERALVFHLPVGEARCTIYEVDITAGWEMAAVCETVRAWRKRKDLGQVVAPLGEPKAPKATGPARVDPPKVPVPTTRDEWIAGRIAVLVVSSAAKKLLAERWPAGVPKKAPWTDEQVDAVDPILTDIETTVEAPFPHNDPSKPSPGEVLAAAHEAKAATEASLVLVRPTPDDGPTVPRADADILRAAAKALEPGRAQRAAAWRAEGKRHGHPWGAAPGGSWTRRCHADNAAALACATHLYDDESPDALTRAALELVIGSELQPSWPTGAVIGTLTIDEAVRLAEIAAAFAASDSEICAELGRRAMTAA